MQLHTLSHAHTHTHSLTQLQFLSKKEIAPFIEAELNLDSKSMAESGQQREGADAVGLGSLEEGRAKREKLFNKIMGYYEI